jgi:hypothetical protein
MKNLLKEEINQIQYLFGYKKGVVVSEQESDTTTTTTPSLPKAEPTTDLGTVTPKTKEEMEDYVNKNPEKYQYAEYSGQLPETQAKSKACLRAGLKFGTKEFKSLPHSIYDRQTKTAYCLVEKLS